MNDKQKKISIFCFLIHLITEIVCFYFLEKVKTIEVLYWITPLMYDAIAFIPQGIIGAFNDKNPKFDCFVTGIILLLGGFLLFLLNYSLLYCSLIIVALGNAFLHIACAKATLKVANGKMSPAAIFVAGGSFGVIIGKILINYTKDLYILLLSLLLIPLSIYAKKLLRDDLKEDLVNYNYHNTKIPASIVIILAIIVIAIRGYIGYGIPSSWNKTIFQSILLYSFMGIGKALGGIFIDSIGIKKTGYISVLLSLPFLCFGDNNMYISLIGVMFFSMTMSITLAIIVSVIPNNPGIAFGFTTIGLFIGTFPTFFIKISSLTNLIILMIILNIISFVILRGIINNE